MADWQHLSEGPKPGPTHWPGSPHSRPGEHSESPEQPPSPAWQGRPREEQQVEPPRQRSEEFANVVIKVESISRITETGCSSRQVAAVVSRLELGRVWAVVHAALEAPLALAVRVAVPLASAAKSGFANSFVKCTALSEILRAKNELVWANTVAVTS